MKKMGTVRSLLFLISVILCISLFVIKLKPKEDFEIFQIYTVEDRDYRRTKINVIVNIPEYEIEELCDKIKEKFETINEEQDELLIRLYNSRADFKEHKCAGQREYKKAGKIHN